MKQTNTSMNQEDLFFLPGYEIREKIKNKELSCEEVTQAFLNRIDRLNPKLNAYITVLKERALEQAREVDNNLELYLNAPLLGIPISVKDLLFDIENTVTTNGSLLCIRKIADKDSLTIQRLKEAKSIFLGKTNVPEFGSEFITKNKLMKPTANPWKLTHSSGGSSGGAASSVAAGLASIAIANDSAGSIRLPSSFCSLFGYMPSFGRVPFSQKEELIFKPLHRIGPIAHTVKDAAIILDVISKYSPLDPDQKPEMSFWDLTEKDLKPLKIGWSPDLGLGIKNDEIIGIIQKRLIEIQKLGFEIEEIKLPIDINEHLEDLKNFILAKYEVLSKEIPVFVKPILGSSISRLLDEATEVSNYDFQKAEAFRVTFRQKMNLLMEQYDLLITPVAASPSFSIKDYPDCIKKLHSDPFVFFASFLFPFNFTGQPAASLPCGFNKDGLPIGLQVIGPENNDSVIFHFCSYYEKAFPWKDKHPKLE